MRIAVLGTGEVGRTVAAGLAGLGHEVTIGSRDAVAARERVGSWLADHPDVAVAGVADAAAAAELVVNATNGAGSLPTLTEAGAAALAGKVVMDIANPLAFAPGELPTLSVDNTDSLAEQIQREFPRARVVKALNTMSATVMTTPRQLADGDHSCFVAGNDTDAKKRVTSLLEELGHTDVIDLGDLSAARGCEMYMPLWLRIWQALGTSAFNIKIVRPTEP